MASSRLSFRWWESVSKRTCACGRQLELSDFDPSWQSLRDEGVWETQCLGWTDVHGHYKPCGRVVVIYDRQHDRQALPRGPAPSQTEREQGVTEEDLV